MSDAVNTLIKQLPPYKGNERLVNRRQDTFDIIREIIKKHRACASQYDKIAADFWKGSVPATAANLYWFAKRHLPYQVEPTFTQTVKTPAAILQERNQFGNDCKHYASFIIGVGEALRRKGHPVKCFYRFASYKDKERNPGHVFAVFVDNGKEIWVDPVPEIGGFNKRYLVPCHTMDKMPPMSRNGNSIGSLYDISGIGEYALQPTRTIAGYNPTNIIAGERIHWLEEMHRMHHMHPHHMHHMHMMPYGPRPMGKAHKKKKKAHHGLHLKIKAPHIKIQPGKLFKKIAMAPSRNAFLLLVKLDTFSLATNMHKKILNDPNKWAKLRSFWEKLGGNSNKLHTAISNGVATYNKLHPKHKITGTSYNEYGMADDSMGVVQVAGAAVLAAAAPVIAAITSLLKSFGVGVPSKGDIDAADAHVHKKHNDAGDDGTANADGSVDHGDGVSTTVSKNADGSQSISYDVKDPIGGGDDGGGGAPASSSGNDDQDDDNAPATSAKGGTFAHMMSNVTGFVSDHKTWFIVGGTAIIAFIVLPKIFHHKGRRR